MILYHGSTEIVEKPRILESARMLDFGKGFYTTTNREQAVRWAQKVAVRRKVDEKFISVYEFDLDAAEKELNILRFDQPDAAWLDFVSTCQAELNILRFDQPDAAWLDFLSTCRSGKRPDKEYDIVFGPVADDNVYATLQLYELGILDKEETLKRLKIESLFNQILFHTEKALGFCIFKESASL